MDKTTKIVLIVIGLILLLCACAGTTVIATSVWSYSRFVNSAEQSVNVYPQVAVEVGHEIADFKIPEGFGAPYSIHFGDVIMFEYMSQSERSHILLAQFPRGTIVNVEEMLKQIQKATGDPNSVWYTAESSLIEQKPITIRGQETTLSINEGVSSDGSAYRSTTATFEGRGGPSVVLIASPIDEWDVEMIEAFLASIQ